MQEHKQISALETKINRLKQKNKKQNQVIRCQSQRIQELQESRQNWKQKWKGQQGACGQDGRHTLGANRKPKGYFYSTQVMSLCVGLFVLCGCSYRGVVRILLYLQLELGLAGSIPSKSSISIWVEKLGYYQYGCSGEIYCQDYALIVDECMVIGQQRLLLILGIEAHKLTKEATVFSQVRILSLVVRPSWKREDIASSIQKVMEKMGKPPLYVISDGASNLKAGISDSGLIRLSDVSHQMALFLERNYKRDPRFVAWSKQLAMTKLQGIMQPHAYLLPPKQRTIARFMNLGAIIEWAKKIIATFDQLTPKEQSHFQWLRAYAAFIDEIAQVFGVTQELIQTLKINGLSEESVELCLQILLNNPIIGGGLLLEQIKAYLQGERAKLPHQASVWHVCSNVIESLFGKFKERLSTNPLNGVTGLVLSLCLHTHQGVDFDITKALEQVSMADVTQWKSTHLIDNQVVKRKKILI